MSILQVTQLSKNYGNIKALKQVSFTINAGEFVVLLGLNGAGKSTLFQLLTGLFVADAGQIEIVGHRLDKQPTAALARIGVVFQQPTLDLSMTVVANLRFHARLHGMGRESQSRIEQELSALQLSAEAHRRTQELSGGNRRRVELARALLHQPALLLMDEPTVGLDPASRQQLLRGVHELCAQRGLAVLWATHLVDEATMAQRVLVLHKGQLLAQATPDDLRQQTGAADLEAAFLSFT
ncbi:ABC transporter ATP-binding protein [Thioflexithrix psekupsensis]|uniref:ABC transporter ATP-binding protein n=1 Tax=Thioflexithrix psekupsensis TaxID=1570016 RepID=A0A251X4B5_9GAMM|nr:ABC transporter ATP-binding protein [Thioflexithrix psekupsensis]OUD12291.1 ABC transporter ATP-binding protein [Thioflexithrix psekupsensis]